MSEAKVPNTNINDTQGVGLEAIVPSDVVSAINNLGSSNVRDGVARPLEGNYSQRKGMARKEGLSPNCPTVTPVVLTETPVVPTETPRPTKTFVPTETPVPTETTMPTETPIPTETQTPPPTTTTTTTVETPTPTPTTTTTVFPEQSVTPEEDTGKSGDNETEPQGGSSNIPETARKVGGVVVMATVVEWFRRKFTKKTQ